MSHRSATTHYATLSSQSLECRWPATNGSPPSELFTHEASLEELFRDNPPRTTAEACRRIEEGTGVKRGLTQVRRFLKKSGPQVALYRCDPNRTIDEHAATQAEFVKKTLEQLLVSVRCREGMTSLLMQRSSFRSLSCAVSAVSGAPGKPGCFS